MSAAKLARQEKAAPPERIGRASLQARALPRSYRTRQPGSGFRQQSGPREAAQDCAPGCDGNRRAIPCGRRSRSIAGVTRAGTAATGVPQPFVRYLMKLAFMAAVFPLTVQLAPEPRGGRRDLMRNG